MTTLITLLAILIFSAIVTFVVLFIAIWIVLQNILFEDTLLDQPEITEQEVDITLYDEELYR